VTNEIQAQPLVQQQRTKRRSKSKPGIPYQTATSDQGARAEATKTLRRFGCEQIGIMDDFENGEVLVAFTHRGRRVQIPFSARGWATMFLKARPYSYRMRTSRIDYEQNALRQGHIAVNSMIRDQIKSDVTRIESGILSFEEVFLPHTLTADGRRVIERERVQELLPKPAEQKVVSLQNRPPDNCLKSQ
jgi:hypothetical protein